MKVSADRLTAARLLLRIEGGAFSSRLMSGETPAPARARVLEVLRWRRALDSVLQPFLRRPVRDLDPEVRVSLRMGLAETMRLGVPSALATDGAVRLVRRLGCSSASGLVNAVLRKAGGAWREAIGRSPPDIRNSHPRWIYDRWVAHFGVEEAEKSMAAAQERAATWVWFRDDDARRKLVEDGVKLETHPWCEGAWSAPRDTRKLVETVMAGAAYAQDPSSQLVARTARALVPGGQNFLDLCAAPGGKTAMVSQLGSWDRVVAGELRLTRARLVQRLVAGTGNVGVVTANAQQPPFEPHFWDLVLLDAPCSGTGTFRRHPELKWRLRPDSIPEMASLQRKLLSAALPLVAPGQVLMYATCSVEAEENEGVVGDLPDGYEPADLLPALPAGVPSTATDAGGIRILPNFEGDGFTMHAIRRLSSRPIPSHTT